MIAQLQIEATQQPDDHELDDDMSVLEKLEDREIDDDIGRVHDGLVA